MSFQNFQELFQSTAGKGPCRAAVIWPEDEHTLDAVAAAVSLGEVEPLLIGDRQRIRTLWEKQGRGLPCETVEAASPEEAVDTAVRLAREGQADIILKGLVETAVVMRRIVRKENGLCQEGVLSHLTLVELPGYHKLLGLTDCALLTYPDIRQKKAAIRNALKFYRGVGQEEVKVAVLAAVEKVNPKMPETVEAAELKEAWRRGELPGSIVEGPISYDLAVVAEAAAIKGYQSTVAGDADLLVVPNITAGNLLVKSLSYSAGGFTAALVLGAKVPVVIPSRSSPVKSKVTALRVAAAMSRGRERSR